VVDGGSVEANLDIIDHMPVNKESIIKDIWLDPMVVNVDSRKVI